MTGLQGQSRSRSFVAIVAAICLLFAIVGFWALRTGLAASASSPSDAPGRVAGKDGGAFSFESDLVRCAFRGSNRPNGRNYNVGFRVAASPFYSGSEI